MSQATGHPNKPAARTAAAPVDDHIDDVPASVAQAEAPKAEASAEGASRAQDILAMIRNRQKQ
jgi:hypothetical protein